MIYTHADGATSHPEEVLDFLTSRLLTSSGVFDVAGGELLVTEEDTPAMSVKIASGYAYLQKANLTKTYPVYVSAVDSVNISANASGNSRIDAIVLYYNSGATPSTDSTGVATLVAIEGTPAGSPSAPSDGAISTVIGASNPFTRLADVEVSSGAVSIVDADITDQRTEATYSIKVNPKSSAISLYLVDATTNVAVGDGQSYFSIPSKLNGLTISAVYATVITAGTTGTTDIQIHNVTNASDVLSTVLTIDSGETGSDTALAPAVIDTANDDVVTNDLFRIDIDAVSTTAPLGLVVRIEFN